MVVLQAGRWFISNSAIVRFSWSLSLPHQAVDRTYTRKISRATRIERRRLSGPFSRAAYFYALSPTSRPREVIKNEWSSAESFDRITNNFLARGNVKVPNSEKSWYCAALRIRSRINIYHYVVTRQMDKPVCMSNVSKEDELRRYLTPREWKRNINE